jgi:glycosyltransferase involved in cell wall biosynthesis
MLVTVAICTLDRAESLRRALDSLTAMSVPHGVTWEVIVVNNGCTDHTDSVITSFARRLPIRRELELQRGLSHARNRAIDTATGEYIIWTDDDVVVDSNWLVEYVNAFRRWPESVVFGGPILPRFEPPVVKWLKACMQSFSYVYAARDFGNVSLRINSGRRIPFGANFALRA